MADGFDHYNYQLDKWQQYPTSYCNVANGGGRRDGGKLVVSRPSYYAFSMPNGVSFDVGDTLIVGFAVMITSTDMLRWTVGAATGTGVVIELRIDSNGYIVLYRGATEIGRSASNPCNQGNKWYYLEWKVLFDNSVGTCEVRINEKTVLNLTGIDTIENDAYLPTAEYTWGGDIWADDFYLCNGEGDNNNDFLGDVAVYTLWPNAAGNYSQWTPSGEATNYLCVDDPWTIDDASTYVGDSISGEIDTYGFDSIPDCEVLGVQMCLWGSTDVSSRKLLPLFRSGGVDYEFSGEITVLSGWDMDVVMMDYLSPATDSQWTRNEINAGEFGYAVGAD
jgi:hypothetical protein